MPLDFTKPDVLQFLIENNEQSTKLRLRWNKLHEDIIKPAATFKGNEKGYTESDISKSLMEAGLATTTRDHKEAARHRLRQSSGHDPVTPCLKEDNGSKLRLDESEKAMKHSVSDEKLPVNTIMRPVLPKDKEIIYKDIPENGRLEYLKARYRTKPEDKFYSEETTSWEYGWRLKDSYFGKNAPQYPRQSAMKESITSRSGPQPNPKHYKSADNLLPRIPCATDL